MTLRPTLLLLVAALTIACREQVLCPSSSPGPLISVFVKDSVTGLFAASGAKLVARGSDVDSASFPNGHADLDRQPLLAAFLEGTYTVTVSKAGYRDWVKSNVTVTRIGCEVHGASFTALLQSSP